MATINVGAARLSQVDFDGQKKQFSVPTAVITAANHDAQKTLFDAFVAAVDDVTLGNSDFEEFVADREMIRPLILPTNAVAQVQIQWLVTYVDGTTGATETITIPCADLTDATLLQAGSPLWDPTDAKWVQFTTDFEAYVLSDAGNAVTLQQVEFKQ